MSFKLSARSHSTRLSRIDGGVDALTLQQRATSMSQVGARAVNARGSVPTWHKLYSDFLWTLGAFQGLGRVPSVTDSMAAAHHSSTIDLCVTIVSRKSFFHVHRKWITLSV